MPCVSRAETSLYLLNYSVQLSDMISLSDPAALVMWLVGFAALILLLYLALSFMKKDIVKKKEIDIENRFKERDAILQVQIDSLRQRESVLRRSALLQTIAITSISHDIKSPVQFIVKSAREIESLINQNQLDRLAKAGEIIGYTGDRIAHLIDEMSEFFKTSISPKTITADVFLLADLVNEKMGTFSDIVSAHGGEIAMEVTREDSVVTNSKLLGIVIHNVIDNAIKAKPANRIRIYTSELATELHLIIADAGPGLPACVMASLNGQDKDTLASDVEHGWGIVIIKEICELLQLRLYAYNTGGANIHIIFGPGKYSKWEHQDR